MLEGGLDELAAVETAELPRASIERADLERALLLLPEGARIAVLLTDLWELDHDEVRRFSGFSRTVKSRVPRAPAHLARLLADHDTAGRRRA